MRRLAIVVTILLLASCAQERETTTSIAEPSASTTTVTTQRDYERETSPGTSTSSSSTPTVVEETTTTRPEDRVFSTATHGLYPDPLPGSDGFFGSGCSPGGDNLPDGIWWGYLRELSDTSVSFDLACIRFDPDPNDDAVEEGGWTIENNNPKLRVVPVTPDAVVTCEWSGCPESPYPYSEWIADNSLPHGESEPDGGVWLFVNGGVVTEIGDMVVAG